jgi:hypothetical protein
MIISHYFKVGVEWDLKGRGKNNGSVGSVQLFSCDEGMGSFVHPARLLLGMTFLEAIRHKYVSQPNSGEPSALPATSPGAVAIDFIGKEKSAARISKLELLTEVWLGRSCYCSML